MFFKKKNLFKLLAFLYLFSVQEAFSNTFLYIHDDNICKTDTNDSDLDCISHCFLEQIENLNYSDNTCFVKRKSNLIHQPKLVNQFSILVAQKSHSPPLQLSNN